MGEIIFYYLRDDNGKPFGCVAISENSDGTINRGVSLCSKDDNFIKASARGIALKRLIDAAKSHKTVYFGAYYGKSQNCPINSNNLLNIGFDTKSAFHVAPTQKEYRTLHKPDFIK